MTTEATRATQPKISRFRIPTLVTYGFGVADQVGDEVRRLGAARVLVVTDRGVVGAGLLAGVERSLGAAGVVYAVLDDVEADPSIETANRTLAALRDCGAEAVVAVGGGSSMDAAKAAALLATNGGAIADYAGIDRAPRPALPLVCVPTTAGTGSEVTSFAVITDRRRHFKMPIGGVNVAARAALVDPLLTVSLPPQITAATGMDALTHAVECYVNKASYPISEALAAKAIELIAPNLRTAVHQGSNLDARDAMMMGAMTAGMAFVNTRLGNVHGMAHAVGGHFGVPHGVANAILLPHVMAFNADIVPAKFAQIARLMGEPVEDCSDAEAAAMAVAAVRRLNAAVGIPPTLSAVAVRAASIPVMAADAMLSGNIAVNPRPTTVEDITAIFEQAM
ncbi:MAG: iron-containing alcohol dehydrogenase [Chloroflexi bacterium]|nr:iron-containing alcohol dehydrogenase [Chloroflexota bacterium]